jgi:hypothetical protein
LGATKIKTNISDVEKKAEDFDKERETFAKLSVQTEVIGKKNEPATGNESMSSRFLVKDSQAAKEVSLNTRHLIMFYFQKLKEAAKDPNKVEIVDRLGIGGLGRGGVSHSISSGIRAINQEGVSKLAAKKSSDSFQSPDDWEIVNGKIWN